MFSSSLFFRCIYLIQCLTPRYTAALQALSHVLLLAPQNPFYVLQFAETAYTADDIPLAIKMFMLAVDIADRHASEESIPTGASVRAWYGVKLVSYVST